jgi:hypothetical protein
VFSATSAYRFSVIGNANDSLGERWLLPLGVVLVLRGLGRIRQTNFPNSPLSYGPTTLSNWPLSASPTLEGLPPLPASIGRGLYSLGWVL